MTLLQENVFGLLKRIKNARRLYIQEGHAPTNEEIAKRVGISVEKLKALLLTTRNPISIQECAWTDQDVTFQVPALCNFIVDNYSGHLVTKNTNNNMV